MTVRRYSSISQETYLTTALNTTATTMVVNSAAVLGSITPAAGERLTLVIDPDTALEEIVYAVSPSSPSSTTITIIRGVDGTGVEGTSGVAHSAGAKVRHMAIAVDFREANNHINNVTTAHGLTIANVLKTTDTNMITAAMLQSNAVTTAKITDANVTTAKIADSNVTTAKIADSNVTTAKIADLNVTTGKLADSAVTSAKIADGTIVTADLADAAVTSAKIADGTIVAGDIADGAVTSAKILDGTIVNADINSSAQIAYGKLALTNGIVDADINASAAIDKTKISGTAITAGDTGTVTSTMIADGTIVNADINASAAIDWTKIAPSSTVSSTELGYLDGVTSAIQTQLDSKLGTSTAASTYAPLASPALTGTPTAPTATAGTNTTQVATTAFVGTAVSNLVAAAPAALDTLNELAASLGNDANFATTVTNNLATKLPLAGGTMSGAIAMGTNKITGLGTPTATGDAATKDYADTKLALTGGTMSGAIAMGTNKITGVGDPTNAQDVVTKYYLDNLVLAPSNLTGPITSVGNVTSIASQTGTGTKFVVDTSPTLVTPVLGVATATSINGTTIPSSKTLVATDSTQYVVPSQTGNAGKFLGTNGTTSSWSNSTTGSFGVGEGIGSGSAVFQIGNDRTADGNAYIDLIGDTTYVDYGLRIIRGSGANGVSQLIHRGTNNFALTATDAANMLLQTNATTRMVINSAGAVGIGTTSPAAGQVFNITKDLTGSTTAIGANVGSTIQSDVTTQARAYNTFISTAAEAFTVPFIYHYRAAQGTFGAGSTVTNQFGFYAESTLTGAGTNVGFYGNIPAGSGDWNFYTGGTAANFFAGRTGIGATLTSGAMAQVVNTTAADIGFIIKGAASQTGNLLEIQNSAGTVSSAFSSSGRFITNQRISIGAQFAAPVFDGLVNIINDASTTRIPLIVRGASGQTVDLLQVQNSAAASLVKIDSSGRVGIGLNTPIFNLDVTSGTAVGSTAGNQGLPARFVMPDGNTTALEFTTTRTSAGSDWATAGPRLQAKVDATYMAYIQYNGGNSSGISFGTGSSATPLGVTERMRIDSSGNTTINAIADATTTTAARGGGYMGIPQSAASGSGAYTVVAADAGEHIYTTTTRTVTIPANATLALPIGTALSFISGVGATTTIAITSDTMYLAGAGTTGSRTLAAHGMATAVKVASTTWYISGNGLS